MITVKKKMMLTEVGGKCRGSDTEAVFEFEYFISTKNGSEIHEVHIPISIEDARRLAPRLGDEIEVTFMIEED